MAKEETGTRGEGQIKERFETGFDIRVRHVAVVVTVMLSFLALYEIPSLRLLLSQPGSVSIVVAVAVTALVPAFLVSVYVRVSNPDEAVPVGVLVVVFCMGAVVAVLAGTLNGFVLGRFRALSVFSLPLFFFLFVGPVEELLKLVAVRLYPGARLDTATKYAVLGAFAGLGFAFSENIFYVLNNVVFGWENAAGAVAGRSAVSPLHVMMTTVAGYYLGRSGLGAGNGLFAVVKGLTVVSVLHATYNTAVTVFENSSWTGSPAVEGVFLVLFFTAVVYAVEGLVRGTENDVSGTVNEDDRRRKRPAD